MAKALEIALDETFHISDTDRLFPGRRQVDRAPSDDYYELLGIDAHADDCGAVGPRRAGPTETGD
jgi:hypothetical protein